MITQVLNKNLVPPASIIDFRFHTKQEAFGQFSFCASWRGLDDNAPCEVSVPVKNAKHVKEELDAFCDFLRMMWE